MKQISKTFNCRMWCTICILSLLPFASVTNAQNSVNPNDAINFADQLIKTLCVNNWDTNKDGELSYAEAASVTSLEYVFNPSRNGWCWAKSFNELQYFTGLTEIGVEAFAGSSNLGEITLPNSVTYIANGAFKDCSSLNFVNFSDALVSIGESAFQNCGALQSVSLPMTTKIIGKCAFSGCHSIGSLTANGVTYFGESAFDGCGTLKSAEIKSAVNICDKAFSGCSSLDGVVLPICLESIGSGAFANCNSLHKLYSKASVPPTAADDAFYNVASCVLYVPVSSIDDYRTANVWEEWFAGSCSWTDGEGLSRNSRGDAVSGFYNIEFVDENGNYDVGRADMNADVVLDESKIKVYRVSQDIKANSVKYIRTFDNYLWQALYVPVAIKMENLDGCFEVARIGVDRNASSAVCFVDADESIAPNTAYAIRLKQSVKTGTYTINCENKICSTKDTTLQVNGAYVLKSSYRLIKDSEIVGKYVLTGEKFVSCTKKASLKPFRFYLEYSASGGMGRAKELDIFFGEEETAIDAIEGGEIRSGKNLDVMVDLNGRIVSGDFKGLVIRNGKKYLR